MKSNDETFFQNKDCPYFPCHQTLNHDEFNCMFCYCPLYTLGESCGGNFCYTQQGIKDCSNCILPHSAQGHLYVMSKFSELSHLAMKKNT